MAPVNENVNLLITQEIQKTREYAVQQSNRARNETLKLLMAAMGILSILAFFGVDEMIENAVGIELRSEIENLEVKVVSAGDELDSIISIYTAQLAKLPELIEKQSAFDNHMQHNINYPTEVAASVFSNSSVNIVDYHEIIQIEDIHIVASTKGHVWVQATFQLFVEKPESTNPNDIHDARVYFSIDSSEHSPTDHRFEFASLKVSGFPVALGNSGIHPVTIQRMFVVEAGEYHFSLRGERNDPSGTRNKVTVKERELNAIFIPDNG